MMGGALSSVGRASRLHREEATENKGFLPIAAGMEGERMANVAKTSGHSRAIRAKMPPTFNVQDLSYEKVNVVYFVRAENGPIKVGTTGRLEWRLKSLRGQSPVPLVLLATVPGNRADEHKFHARFAAHRLHGEWFAPHPDILAEIERLNEPPVTD